MAVEVDVFEEFVRVQAQERRVQAGELVQEAQLIEAAWACKDFKALEVLGVIGPQQAIHLQQQWVGDRYG